MCAMPNEGPLGQTPGPRPSPYPPLCRRQGTRYQGPRETPGHSPGSSPSLPLDLGSVVLKAERPSPVVHPVLNFPSRPSSTPSFKKLLCSSIPGPHLLPTPDHTCPRALLKTAVSPHQVQGLCFPLGPGLVPSSDLGLPGTQATPLPRTEGAPSYPSSPRAPPSQRVCLPHWAAHREGVDEDAQEQQQDEEDDEEDDGAPEAPPQDELHSLVRGGEPQERGVRAPGSRTPGIS